MKNEKKISAISKAIQMLENGFDYNWSRSCACNNGVVLLASGADRQSIIEDFYAWRDNNLENDMEYSTVRNYMAVCPITQLPLGYIRDKMMELGMTGDDINNLEYLKDKRVLKKIGVKHLAHDVKENLLSYLRAWVELLTEEDAKEITREANPAIRYIAIKVDKTIFEQAKSLIEN